MPNTLQPGDRVVVGHVDSPGREHWAGMSGTVVEVEDIESEGYSLLPVLVRVDQLEAAFHFGLDELQLAVSYV